MMTSLGYIFTSRARVALLEALAHLENPVGLRRLSWICDIHPRSAELALKGLIEEKRVLRKMVHSKPTYQWNGNHPEADRLRTLFQIDARERLKATKPLPLNEGKDMMEFMQEAHSIIQLGKEQIHAVS
jgi:hypothetical protein